MTLDWPIIIACAVGISLLLSVIVIPQILHVAHVKRLFDNPSSRKVHTGVVPRLGGFTFLPVLLITLGLTLVIPASYSGRCPIVACDDFIASLPDIIVLFAAMTIMFLTGLYDDLLGVKYGFKFIAQIICAVLLVEAGVIIMDYNDLFGIGMTSVVMGKIITGFLIVYVINGLNLIDGIDGLAAGLSVIALSFYGIVLYLEQHFMFSLLSWSGAAIMASFWFFNVLGSKKRRTKLFMGDVGSLSAGIFLAFMMVAVARQPQYDSAWGLRPIILAFSPLVLPLFDVVRVFFVRIIHGGSPFLPDKRHIHHLMLACGMRMRLAMGIFVFAQAAVIALNLWLSEYWGINVVLIFDVAIYVAGVMILEWARKTDLKKQKK